MIPKFRTGDVIASAKRQGSLKLVELREILRRVACPPKELLLRALLRMTILLIFVSGAGSSFAQGTAKSGSSRPTLTPYVGAMIQDLKSKKQMTLGSKLHYSQAIPSNFPVPTYPNNVVKTTFINSTKGSPRAVLGIITRDPPQTAFQWYLAACKKDNWVVRTPTAKFTGMMAKTRQLYILKAARGNQQLDICCVRSPKTSNTTIGVTFSLKR